MNGCGSGASHLRKNASILAADSRSQIRCSAAGSSQPTNPLSSSQNASPAAWRGRQGRAHEHHNPIQPFGCERSGLFRPRVAQRKPRRIPDEKFNELFALLSSDRDRALVAFWVSTGPAPVSDQYNSSGWGEAPLGLVTRAWFCPRSRRVCRGRIAEVELDLVVAGAPDRTRQDDPSPSLQPHYRAFMATTDRSAPVPRITTFSPSRSAHARPATTYRHSTRRYEARSLTRALPPTNLLSPGDAVEGQALVGLSRGP